MATVDIKVLKVDVLIIKVTFLPRSTIRSWLTWFNVSVCQLVACYKPSQTTSADTNKALIVCISLDGSPMQTV